MSDLGAVSRSRPTGQANLRCPDAPRIDRGEGDLPNRIAKLLHPTRGICRGIIETDEQGKGGRDPDSKLTNISFGELREIHAVLTEIQEQVQ